MELVDNSLQCSSTQFSIRSATKSITSKSDHSLQESRTTETVTVKNIDGNVELDLSQERDKKVWSPDRENIDKYLEQIKTTIETSLVID